MTDSHEPHQRRGLFSEDGEPIDPAGSGDSPPQPGGDPAEHSPPDEAAPQTEPFGRSPFARPGDGQASGEPPSFVPPPAMPQGFLGEPSEERSPLARRSALSSVTPTEEEPSQDTTPRRSAASPPSGSSPGAPASQSSMPPSPPKAPPPVNGGGGGGWWAHHRKTPLGWASAIVAIALAVALTSYFTRRVEPAPSPTPSPSPTVTPPALDESALLSESDAAELSESAVWAITATSTDPADQRGRAACLSTDSRSDQPHHFHAALPRQHGGQQTRGPASS